MPPIMVDLYSDTVTRPSAAMRRAMCEAEVGNEQEREDPTVNALQERAAALLGKEAALFLPSGTMCNQVAFAVWCRPGDQIILHETAHPLLYEAGGPTPLTGALMHPLPGPRGMFTAEQVESVLRPRAHYYPQSRVVSIEQTTNISGGHCWPLAQIEAISALARDRGLMLHMDGARLLNAVVATGVSAADYARPFDSVWLDLTKGLGAPVGAVLAGSRDFIEAAWVFKQRFGGAMRQAGIIAAAGLYALEHNVARLAEDHANARRLAEGLAGIGGITLDPSSVSTNIVIFDLKGSGVTSEQFVARALADHGVRYSVIGPTIMRAVTHLDIPPGGIDLALKAATQVMASRPRPFRT